VNKTETHVGGHQARTNSEALVYSWLGTDPTPQKAVVEFGMPLQLQIKLKFIMVF
jgi:hypothetical protein